jgi:porphobilinogen synthase
VEFPTIRMRRLRRNETIRAMVRETTLDAKDLIYPLFVKWGTGVHDEIASMPGVFHHSIDMLEAEVAEIVSLGIPAVILFGLPEHKDEAGSGAFAADGIVQQAIRRIKELAPDLYVITDVCMCEYTSHGHCGAIDDEGCVINDVTLEMLATTALSHAEAGVDMVAPSDMMDGRVAAIRAALDNEGFTDIPIMSYSAKYASGYYGPFRDAADSTPTFGDRKQYQMDPANSDEAIRETALDVSEGADIVIVKPALAYMDIIRRVKDTFGMPTCAYNVSGEYAMVKAAAANGWIDEQRVVLETLTGFRRAGADLIITYHAKDAARWLRG